MEKTQNSSDILALGQLSRPTEKHSPILSDVPLKSIPFSPRAQRKLYYSPASTESTRQILEEEEQYKNYKAQETGANRIFFILSEEDQFITEYAQQKAHKELIIKLTALNKIKN